jgi:hypothetical protein
MQDDKPKFVRRVIMSNVKPRVEKSCEVLEHIDPTKKVRVYRNLHKGCISVRQGNLVKCHTDNVILKDFKTIVGKKGQERVRREKAKNVHAFIEGYVVSHVEICQDENQQKLLDFRWGELYYNPYKTDDWTELETGKAVDCGEFADIATDFVLASNYLYSTSAGA